MTRSRDLTLDADRREAIVRGAAVELTSQEFDLLHLLAARPGIVFSRAALLQSVWSDDTYVTERTVDTVISRLRRKIERDAARSRADPHGLGRRLQVRRHVWRIRLGVATRPDSPHVVRRRIASAAAGTA